MAGVGEDAAAFARLAWERTRAPKDSAFAHLETDLQEVRSIYRDAARQVHTLSGEVAEAKKSTRMLNTVGVRA